MKRKLITFLVIVGLLALSLDPQNSFTSYARQPNQPVSNLVQTRALQVITFVACEREDAFLADATKASPSSEDLMTRLIAKIALINLNSGCPNPRQVAEGETDPLRCNLDRDCLTTQVNLVLNTLADKPLPQLGTDDPCGFLGKYEGDYDVGLRGLIWILTNFPPAQDNPPSQHSKGLSPEVYKKVRDKMLTVDGASPYEPDGYSYHVTNCGNKEHRSGSPAERAAQYEAYKKACEALGANCSPQDYHDDSDSCFSNWLCSLAVILLVILAVALPIVAAAAAAAAAVATGIIAAVEYTIAAVATVAAVAAVVAVPALLGARLPETENHVLMIESSRFLINNLMRRDLNCTDPTLTSVCDPEVYPGSSELFDNERNGMVDWLLEYLQTTMREDFVEYNSRPYQRYAGVAIQNLYDMACALENPCSPGNLRVKTAARIVLDYIAAKFSVSSSTLKRLAPYRRKLEFKVLVPGQDDDHYQGLLNLFSNHADYQTMRFAMLMGMRDIPPCEELTDDHICTTVLDNGWIELLLTAVSPYTVPAPLNDILSLRAVIPGGDPAYGVLTGCNGYLQHYHHAGTEIYYCARTYLLSAGGIETGPAYKVLGLFGNEDDHGLALPTLLMPHGVGTQWTDFIRFEGNGVSGVEQNSPNLCVDRGFACGVNPVLPDAYKDPACHQLDGDWHFIDARLCPAVHAEFYVAYYERDCSSLDVSGKIKCINNGALKFGMLEVRDSSGLGFDTFKARVKSQNAGFVLDPEDNTYIRTDGSAITFNPLTASLTNEDYDDWPLADGDVVWADGKGCIIISPPHYGQSRVLSLSNLAHPFILELQRDIVPFERSRYCSGFVRFGEAVP